MNRAEEDYIKAIFEIQQDTKVEYVSNVMLMNFFSHTAQSVNEMVKRLRKNALVEYQPYKGSRLTPEGREIAIRLIRIHRIWEIFLIEKLGYSWEEVHEEAERFEHITSKKMEERLYHYLDKPQYCPHGKRIPGTDYMMEDPNANNLRLNQAQAGHFYQLKSVTDDKDILVYLNTHAITIGSQMRVNAIDYMSEWLEIEIDGRIITLGFKIAHHLFVKNIGKDV